MKTTADTRTASPPSAADPGSDSRQPTVRDDRPPTAVELLIRRAGYPVLLGAVVVVAVAAPLLDWDLGVTSGLFLVGAIGYLLLLERLIPYERSWHPTRREWRWYGIYFGLTITAGGLSQLPVMAIVGALSPPEAFLHLGLEIPLALLLGSLASYLVHRWCHTVALLWRFHGVHHVPEKVNVANNGVNHVFDVLLSQVIVQVSLALAGFSQPAVFAVGLFVIAQGYFVHANIDVRLGWLNYLVVGPEQHRLHHSVDLSEAGHYGSDLAIWDHLFGSYTWRPGRAPTAVGLSDPTSFPSTGAVVATLAHPFRRHSAR